MVLSQRRRSARRRPWRGRALAGVEAAPRAPRRSPVRPLALRKGQRQRRRSQWDCGDDCWAGGTAAALCFFCAPEPRPSTPTARAGRQPVLAILDRVVRAARGSLAAAAAAAVGRHPSRRRGRRGRRRRGGGRPLSPPPPVRAAGVAHSRRRGCRARRRPPTRRREGWPPPAGGVPAAPRPSNPRTAAAGGAVGGRGTAGGAPAAAGPPVGVGRSGLGDASGGPLSLCACACRLVLTTRAALCFCVCLVLAAVLSFGGLSTKIADDDLVRTLGFSLLLRRCRRPASHVG